MPRTAFVPRSALREADQFEPFVAALGHLLLDLADSSHVVLRESRPVLPDEPFGVKYAGQAVAKHGIKEGASESPTLSE